jgi:MFS family permease
MGRWPDSLEVVVFALIGVPTYVCASGATPLVAVLLGKGMSAGAALAFLLTGPATNATTFGILARLHGRRIALAFSAGIFALAVALGLATNALVSGGISAPRDEPARESVSALSWACMGAIALLYSFSFLRRGPRRFVGEIIQTGEEPEAAQHHSHAHADDERSTPPSARLLDDES